MILQHAERQHCISHGFIFARDACQRRKALRFINRFFALLRYRKPYCSIRTKWPKFSDDGHSNVENIRKQVSHSQASDRLVE